MPTPVILTSDDNVSTAEALSGKPPVAGCEAALTGDAEGRHSAIVTGSDSVPAPNDTMPSAIISTSSNDNDFLDNFLVLLMIPKTFLLENSIQSKNLKNKPRSRVKTAATLVFLHLFAGNGILSNRKYG